jgi:hypothetical protein
MGYFTGKSKKGRMGEEENGRRGEWEKRRMGEKENGRKGEWEKRRMGDKKKSNNSVQLCEHSV